MAHAAEVLRIVQITDPHLRRESNGTLLGMNTRDSLQAVLDLVRQQHPTPDLVLATGDIAQDGSVEAYRAFRAATAEVFTCPVYWFAGNHDRRGEMQQVIAGTTAAERAHVSDAWQLIFLDSSCSGQVHGLLEDTELRWLEERLAAYPDHHTLICLHHHPVDIDCRWLEPIGLQNRDDFFAIVDRFPQVRGILWGHIHQTFDAERKGVRLLAAPSTCVQFAPKSDDFAVDQVSPGYRWLNLHPDGRIETDVLRVEQVFKVDLNSSGY